MFSLLTCHVMVFFTLHRHPRHTPLTYTCKLLFILKILWDSLGGLVVKHPPAKAGDPG